MTNVCLSLSDFNAFISKPLLQEFQIEVCDPLVFWSISLLAHDQMNFLSNFGASN